MSCIYFIKNHIQIIINHPFSQHAYFCGIETVKVVSTKLFLEIFSRQIFSKISKTHQNRIYLITIIGPIIEEILFRGLLQKGFHLIQYLDSESAKLTDADKKAQEIFRVRMTALIFGAAHLFNPHKSVLAALYQFVWTGSLGLDWGYLVEKYHTLSIGIIAHGINNTLATIPLFYPKTMAVCTLAIIINKTIFSILAYTDISICPSLNKKKSLVNQN